MAARHDLAGCGQPGEEEGAVSRGLRGAIAEFIYGVTSYEFVRHAVEERAALERVFLLCLFGDMLGLPILPPYYSLRLLPYVVPQIETWKRVMVREREFGESHEHHLHGL